MPKAVAFLRAINVGGHTVKMDHLRALFQSMGFSNVETVIASGNVIFDAPRGGQATTEKKIAAALENALGYPVATFVRTIPEVKKIAAYEPFHDAASGTVYLGLLPKSPSGDVQAKLMAFGSADDTFHFAGRELYWLGRIGFAQSKISGALIEKTLGLSTTLRNINTIRRIAAMFA